MQRMLSCVALAAAALLMPAAYAETPRGALPQLTPGESLDLALVIPFGATGYVASIQINDDKTVTVLAVRLQREDDYH